MCYYIVTAWCYLNVFYFGRMDGIKWIIFWLWRWTSADLRIFLEWVDPDLELAAFFFFFFAYNINQFQYATADWHLFCFHCFCSVGKLFKLLCYDDGRHSAVIFMPLVFIWALDWIANFHYLLWCPNLFCFN